MTDIRRSNDEPKLDDPPPMAGSIGWVGWLAVFGIFAVAVALVANF
jgi:hypothetical protein